LFGRFIGTMAPSDFSPTCMLGVRLTAFPSRPEPTFGHGRDLPGSVQRTSPRAWGLRLREVPSLQASCAGTDVAFSSAVRDRHLGIRPVSQLNTQPVVSPVNASRRPSRDAAHHSGPGRLARPYPVEDLHLLSFASFPGAHRYGSTAPIRCFSVKGGFRVESSVRCTWAKEVAICRPPADRTDVMCYAIARAELDARGDDNERIAGAEGAAWPASLTSS
jgi:hypothetical protein